jgi:acetamidase/formamidase
VGQADAAAFVFDAVRVELVVAVRETILFLTQRFLMLSREEAYMIASVAVD